MTYLVRPGRADEVARYRAIEVAAGAAFRDAGMPEVAADEPPLEAALLGYVRAGRAWAVADDGGEPAGYLLLDVLDAADAHVEQVSVLPSCRGLGLGARLLDAAAAWARERGYRRLTLTTFADVPWNAPYYARLGFRTVPDEALTEPLRAVRRREAEHGLDRWPRVVMARDLDR
ncbi:MAG TPA: GNAT family N-acetyltransferase [Mycobacteriales bacterium]|nr:GNAT family N-acetyltransferase [Mycobacteriales bacterium]